MKVEDTDFKSLKEDNDTSLLNESSTIETEDNIKLSRKKLIKELSNGAQAVFRRSWINEIPLIILFLFSFFSAIIGTIKYPTTVKTVNLDLSIFGQFSFSVALLIFVALVPCAFIIHKLVDNRYIITKDSVISISGLLSFKITKSRMHISHIRGIEVERSLLQRFLNTGDLLLGSSAMDSQEIRISGIYKPAYYQGIVELLMKDYIEDIN